MSGFGFGWEGRALDRDFGALGGALWGVGWGFSIQLGGGLWGGHCRRGIGWSVFTFFPAVGDQGERSLSAVLGGRGGWLWLTGRLGGRGRRWVV